MKNRTTILLGILILSTLVLTIFGGSKSISRIVSATINANQANTGQWAFAALPDSNQFLTESVPVAVFRVTATSAKGQPYKVEQGILENRYSENVEEVTLRWTVTTLENRDVPL